MATHNSWFCTSNSNHRSKWH